MRTFGTFLVTAIFACVMGCGGGSSSGGISSSGRSGSTGGQCPASSSGQTCTGEDAYSKCEMAACGTQYKACFGNNFASGNFTGGSCADFITCEMACPCDPPAAKQTCESNCTAGLATTAGATCAACALTLDNCVTAAETPPTGTGTCAPPVCTTISTNTNTTTTTTTTTTTSTGTNCVALQTCCTKITDATVKSACQSSITNAGGVDSTCALILQGIQSYCP